MSAQGPSTRAERHVGRGLLATLVLRLPAVAVALVLGTAAGCDTSSPGDTPSQRPDGPQPVIDAIGANPNSTTGRDQPMVLTAVAHAPAGKKLEYNWTASDGILSATTGSSVSWKPETNDGRVTPGTITITLIVTAGAYSATATQDISVSNGGIATWGAGLPMLGNGIPIGSGITPTPGVGDSPAPSASSAGGATIAASPMPAIEPSGCGVSTLKPFWVMPGGAVYVAGHGFARAAHLSLNDVSLATLQASSNLVVGQVGSATVAAPDAVPVTITGCAGTPMTAGDVVVADLSDVGGAALPAGTGLLAEAQTVPAGTASVPDLTSMTPIGSFLAPNLNVPHHSLVAGLPSQNGPITRWFALRYRGQLNVTSAGTTRFKLAATDGARLYLDSKLVVDADVGTRATGVEADVDLTAGKHSLRVDYMAGASGTMGLQLTWTPPGAKAQVPVPASVLSPPFSP